MVIYIKFHSYSRYIKFNNFEELLKLKNYNHIKYINCDNNNLTSLPDNLPSYLIFINCSYNKLTSLPDNLPTYLNSINCSNNNLTSLPDNLHLCFRQNSLETLYYNNNPIYELIKKYHNGDWKEYIKWKKQYKKVSNIIGSWFLECKYNPKYKYCKARLNKEYNELYC